MGEKLKTCCKLQKLKPNLCIIKCAKKKKVLPQLCYLSYFSSTETDIAVVYSAVRTNNIIYGQIDVTAKRKGGTAAVYLNFGLRHISGLHAKLC